MVIAEILRPIEQVHGNGHNGHRAGELIGDSIPPTVPSGAEAGIKGPKAPSLQEQIFAQDPEIKKRLKELDEVSEEWMNAKLLGRNYTASIWEVDAWAAGEKLRQIIEGVKLPSSIEGEMYEKLCDEVGGEGVMAVRSPRIGEDGSDLSSAELKEIFIQEGKGGVLYVVKQRLAVRFAGEAVRRRNEARLKMAHDLLESGSADIDSAIAESKSLSHQESNLPVVVQRWQMPSRQK